MSEKYYEKFDNFDYETMSISDIKKILDDKHIDYKNVNLREHLIILAKYGLNITEKPLPNSYLSIFDVFKKSIKSIKQEENKIIENAKKENIEYIEMLKKKKEKEEQEILNKRYLL